MTVKFEKKAPEATVSIQKTKSGVPGPVKEEKITPLTPVVTEKPMANVGMKVGKTTNLGNYESVRVDVSLFMPAEPNEDAVNEAFEFIEGWLDLKMDIIMKELEEAT